MLQIATQGQDGLVVDPRELLRDGPSYSIDTLAALRKEFPEAALCLVIGEDAYASFTQWHNWQGILDLAHIIIATRPGYVVDTGTDEKKLLEQRLVENSDDLSGQQAGCIYRLPVTALEISATQIRAQIAIDNSPRYLLPDTVLNYIHEHGLYQ